MALITRLQNIIDDNLKPTNGEDAIPNLPRVDREEMVAGVMAYSRASGCLWNTKWKSDTDETYAERLVRDAVESANHALSRLMCGSTVVPLSVIKPDGATEENLLPAYPPVGFLDVFDYAREITRACLAVTGRRPKTIMEEARYSLALA